MASISSIQDKDTSDVPIEELLNARLLSGAKEDANPEKANPKRDRCRIKTRGIENPIIVSISDLANFLKLNFTV